MEYIPFPTSFSVEIPASRAREVTALFNLRRQYDAHPALSDSDTRALFNLDITGLKGLPDTAGVSIRSNNMTAIMNEFSGLLDSLIYGDAPPEDVIRARLLDASARSGFADCTKPAPARRAAPVPASADLPVRDVVVYPDFSRRKNPRPA